MKKEAKTIGAAKILRASLSFTGDIEGVSSQIVIPNAVANIAVAQFTRRDFETALHKVSQRRNLPIGEHIREASRIIKNHKDYGRDKQLRELKEEIRLVRLELKQLKEVNILV